MLGCVVRQITNIFCWVDYIIGLVVNLNEIILASCAGSGIDRLVYDEDCYIIGFDSEFIMQ